jgi:hypothetical protein
MLVHAFQPIHLMVTFSCSCNKAPLTEIEKIRANTMMRNHRIFQSLGIGTLVSMIRKSNDAQEDSAVTSHGSTSAIPRGESSDYNPRDDVIDEEEVDESVVEKNVKVQTLILFGGVGLIVYCVITCFLSFCSHTVFLTCDLMLFSLLFVRGPKGF